MSDGTPEEVVVEKSDEATEAGQDTPIQNAKPAGEAVEGGSYSAPVQHAHDDTPLSPTMSEKGFEAERQLQLEVLEKLKQEEELAKAKAAAEAAAPAPAPAPASSSWWGLGGAKDKKADAPVAKLWGFGSALSSGVAKLGKQFEELVMEEPRPQEKQAEAPSTTVPPPPRADHQQPPAAEGVENREAKEAKPAESQWWGGWGVTSELGFVKNIAASSIQALEAGMVYGVKSLETGVSKSCEAIGTGLSKGVTILDQAASKSLDVFEAAVYNMSDFTTKGLHEAGNTVALASQELSKTVAPEPAEQVKAPEPKEPPQAGASFEEFFDYFEGSARLEELRGISLGLAASVESAHVDAVLSEMSTEALKQAESWRAEDGGQETSWKESASASKLVTAPCCTGLLQIVTAATAGRHGALKATCEKPVDAVTCSEITQALLELSHHATNASAEIAAIAVSQLADLAQFMMCGDILPIGWEAKEASDVIELPDDGSDPASSGDEAAAKAPKAEEAAPSQPPLDSRALCILVREYASIAIQEICTACGAFAEMAGTANNQARTWVKQHSKSKGKKTGDDELKPALDALLSQTRAAKGGVYVAQGKAVEAVVEAVEKVAAVVGTRRAAEAAARKDSPQSPSRESF